MNNHQGKASTPINLRALELIREAFKRSPLTQEVLAERAGIPRSTLANMLSESATPRLVNVEWFSRIALALGVDPGDWMDELEEVARRFVIVDDLAARRRPSSATPLKKSARPKGKPRAGD